MTSPEKLERQFRELHKKSVAEYDAALSRAEDLNAHTLQARKKDKEQQFDQASKILNVPRASLDEPQNVVSTEVHAIHRAVRGNLSNRSSSQLADAKRFAQHPALQIPNARVIPVYATNIMSSTREEVKDIDGERGNPWVLPWNPGHIQIVQVASNDQYGLCGWAQVATYPQIADVYFPFLADTTANWNFMAFGNLHGFYLVDSTNHFLLCRYASAEVRVSTLITQYYDFPETLVETFHVRTENGLKSGLIDQSIEIDSQAALRADPDWYVFVRLRFSIFADAYCGYSEINFEDGAGNYIDPLLVIAYPS